MLGATALSMRPAAPVTDPMMVVKRQPSLLVRKLATGPEAKVTPIWMEFTVEISPLPALKCSLKYGRNTPKLTNRKDLMIYFSD